MPGEAERKAEVEEFEDREEPGGVCSEPGDAGIEVLITAVVLVKAGHERPLSPVMGRSPWAVEHGIVNTGAQHEMRWPDSFHADCLFACSALKTADFANDTFTKVRQVRWPGQRRKPRQQLQQGRCGC